MKREGLEKEMGPRMPELDRLIETMLSKEFHGKCEEKSVSMIELNKIFQRYVRWVSEKWTSRNHLGDNYVLGGIHYETSTPTVHCRV